MSEKAKFVLICGPSGTGKSTLAKYIAKRLNMRHICADDFYAKVNGDECIHANKFEVWIEIFRAIHACETEGVDCILDTNALSASERDEYINWFPGFNHYMVYVDADDALRSQNNHHRRRRIPDGAMAKMRAKAEPPVWASLNKMWVSLIRIQNINNQFEVIQEEGDTLYAKIKDLVL